MHQNRLPIAMLALAICSSTLHALPASPLIPTFTPTGAVSLTYTLPSTPGSSVSVSLATAAVAVGPASHTFYSVDPTTVPYWLAVSAGSGNSTVVSPITAGSVAGTPSTFTLGPSTAASSLGQGVYSTTVQLDVVGSAPLNIPVTLTVIETASVISVSQGTTVLSALTWSKGAPQVPFSFNLVSAVQPVAYTVTAGVLTSTGVTSSTGLSFNPASGLASPLGSQVSVTLSPLVYAEAQVGDVITDTITVHYASTSFDIAFSLTVGATASITSLTPASVPVDTDTSDVVHLVITGSGFVPSGTHLHETTAVFAGGNATRERRHSGEQHYDPGRHPSYSHELRRRGHHGNRGLESERQRRSSERPGQFAGKQDLKIVTVPIINTITSASSFLEAGANATFAPYDFITIFGTNLCPDCSGGSTNLSGSPDPTFFRYPTALSPDSGTHFLQVQFNKHSNQTLVAQGYLIFANNTQINLLVPASLATVTSGALLGMGTVDVVVSYGTTVPPTVPMASESSDPYTVGVALSNPGIFTLNAAGTGQGAIVTPNFALNSMTNAITHGTGVAIIYMTGLGAPNSTASNATTTALFKYPASCISALGTGIASAPIGYMKTVNSEDPAPSPLWTSVDGAIIQSALIVGNGVSHFAPCNSPVTATVAGINATVLYAGWVADSVAGLYQVNLTVPSGAASGSAVQVPVVITANGVSSQPGVTLWAK